MCIAVQASVSVMVWPAGAAGGRRGRRWARGLIWSSRVSRAGTVTGDPSQGWTVLGGTHGDGAFSRRRHVIGDGNSHRDLSAEIGISNVCKVRVNSIKDAISGSCIAS